MIFFAAVVALILGVMLVIAIINALVFPRLQLATLNETNAFNQPSGVSILIPARNEGAIIGSTVQALLTQRYPNFEIIVLDDHSTDNTRLMAESAARGDSRLRVLAGTPLPVDWLGKNWACHQLAAAACHEILIFTDADVTWGPHALPALIQMLHHTQADLLTVWPTQITLTWGERLVVPLMALAILGYLPVPLVHYGPWPSAAAGSGQCMVFRRAAYLQCGGHQAVRSQIVEDTQLAQRIKASGLRLRLADGAALLHCRMYEGWSAVLFGYAKNILAGHGNSIALLLLSTFFHLTIFVLPWLWLTVGFVGLELTGWPLWPLLLCALGVTLRGLTAMVTRQRPLDALFLPISVLLMTRIALQAIWWQLRDGGPRWKDRKLLQ